MTYSEYLELFEAIGVKLRKTHDMQVVDKTVRKFFLNFTTTDHGAGQKQRYEIAHNLKEPWAGFVKTNNFVRGRQSDTAVEPILLQMYEALLSYQDFKERLAGLRSLVGTLTPSSRVADKSFLV